ncbi:hypothetical protein XELAEV_18011952mg [Xenopus laevis]|uniref:Uncharacterized protein n=1 Tax=Xenopus laevis TaxID=8355 RepID=A0A974DLV2_XENLA|nr:hypothetical protein XELAEV_18011952mg [Xenopus laevis]
MSLLSCLCDSLLLTVNRKVSQVGKVIHMGKLSLHTLYSACRVQLPYFGVPYMGIRHIVKVHLDQQWKHNRISITGRAYNKNGFINFLVTVLKIIVKSE